MILDIILTLFSGVFFVFLGTVVYFHDKKSVTNSIFVVNTCFLTLYVIFNFISIQIQGIDALFWIRMAVAFGVPNGALFWLFVYNFPRDDLRFTRPQMALWMVGAFAIIPLVLSPYVFSGIEYQGDSVVPTVGPAVALVGAYLAFYMTWAFVLVIQRYIAADKQDKGKLKSIIGGLGITYTLLTVLVFFNVVLFKNSTYVNYVPVLFVPLMFGMAYGIVRHQLFSVKLIASEIFLFLILTVSVSQLLTVDNFTETLIAIFITVTLAALGILLIRSVVREVEQRQQLQLLTSKLKKANEHLQELLNMKSEFISIASHQLRTPLTALRGLLDMQVKGDFDGLPKESVHKYQTDMFNSADRLNTLVNDLLGAMEMEGGIKLEFKSVDLNELIQQVIDTLTPDYERKGLTISFTKNDDLPTISADPRYLREVIMNLVSNAEKYTEKGGVELSLLNKPADQKVELRVKDTGMGITKEEKKKIFGKFERAKRAIQIHANGSGLGLFIIKKIVTGHNGSIAIESDGINKGSTFVVQLPVKQDVESKEIKR